MVDEIMRLGRHGKKPNAVQRSRFQNYVSLSIVTQPFQGRTSLTWTQ